MINSICIVRLSALGDVLMLVPLVRTLQENYPKAKISWVISNPAYQLVRGMDGVEFIVIDKPKTLADYWRFYQQMRAQRFDVLLGAQASFRANCLYPLIKAKRKVGYDKARAKDLHRLFVSESIAAGCDHTLVGFLKFADVLGVKKRVVRWDLPIGNDDNAWVQTRISKCHDKPLILINPAASKPERSWLVERYVEVIKYLQSRWQAQIVLTGGPVEYDKQLGVQIEKHVSVTNLIGETKPKQLLALIGLGDVLLAPDTGPAHMAAAVGTPVVALHAVTNPEISGPYTYRHLAVNNYPEAVKSILNTSLENNRWGTQVHGDDAMKTISVADVIAKLDAVLGVRGGTE